MSCRCHEACHAGNRHIAVGNTGLGAVTALACLFRLDFTGIPFIMFIKMLAPYH